MSTTGTEAFQILLSLAVVLQTALEHRAFTCGPRQLSGKVAIILPVKGLDPALDSTLYSLESQDYEDKEIFVVVDSPDDPAISVVKRHKVKLLFNSWPCSSCSGKVAAIITALKEIRADYYVFVDSDTIYPQGWLRCTLSLLEPGKTVVTTFSWPSPIKFSLMNAIRSGFWTLGYESMFSANHRFLWGGSMAFSREFFDESVVKALESAWCDDCTLGYIAKSKGYRIELSRVIPLNVFDERNLIEFLRRQALTVYLYSKKGLMAFVVIWSLVLVSTLLTFVSPLGVLPLMLWIAKNLVRAVRAKASPLPALFSVVSSTLVLFLLPWFLRSNEVVWRGRRIKVK